MGLRMQPRNEKFFDPTHDVHLPQLHRTVTLPPPVVLTAATARPLIDQAMPDQDPMHCDPRRNRPRATRPLQLEQHPTSAPARMSPAELADQRLDRGNGLCR